MHNEPTSRHIRSATELFIVVPLRTEFVPITDLVMSYATRVSTVLKALAELRQQKVERGYGDPVGPIERLQTIHRVQWTVLEPFDDVGSRKGSKVTRQTAAPQVVLTSHFDSSWEDYFYELVDVGKPLLDLIFSHCQGYDRNSCKDGYEAFSDFIRRHQRPCDFMYANAPEVTIDDIRYYNLLLPSLLRSGSARSLTVPTVEEQAIRDRNLPGVHDPQTRSAARALLALHEIGERLFSSATELTTRAEKKFSGTELYKDAIKSVLEYEPDLARLRSALEALQAPAAVAPRQVVGGGAGPGAAAAAPARIPPNLQRAAGWIQGLIPDLPGLPPPALQAANALAPREARPAPDLGPLLESIQANVLSGYERVDSGKLLLFCCKDARAVRDLLAAACPSLTSEAKSRAVMDDVHVNLSLTYSGLSLLGLPNAVLEQFPREFREGAEERAGILGDVGHNHPQEWRTPMRRGRSERIHLSIVHVALTLHGRGEAVDKVAMDWGERANTVRAALVHVLDLHPSGEPEWSQPLPPAPYQRRADGQLVSELDVVALGELLLGYENRMKRSAACADPEQNKESSTLFKNGTFMVMRQMQQDEPAIQDYVDGIIQKHWGSDLGEKQELLREEVQALIIGRKRKDGRLLGKLQPASGQPANAFDFSTDPAGESCPHHSHIRRANPRTLDAPRIARRSKPYREGDEQGLLFIAYCASLAEQYEIVQRWVNGGNSSKLTSRQNDLLCGAPLQKGVPRYVDLKSITAVPLPARKGAWVSLPDPPKPFVTLRWGHYFFVPSITAVKWLVDGGVAAEDQRAHSDRVERGRTSLDELAALPNHRRLHEWKRILEEVPEAGSAQATHAEDVLAAISAEGGAILVEGDPKTDTPPMVVVTTYALAKEVLSEDTRFSVHEYRTRMNKAFVDHYLGYDLATVNDEKLDYARLSKIPNALLPRLLPKARQRAHDIAKAVLDDPGPLQLEPDPLDAAHRSAISVRDLARAVIAKICHDSLAMPDELGDGPKSLAEVLDAFLVASRYCFQASPVDFLRDTARGNQVALVKAYAELGADSNFQRELVKDIAEAGESYPDPEKFKIMAKLGAVVGFAPPAVGAIIRVLDQWIENERLWQLQAHDRTDVDALRCALFDALGKTPSPPTLYRVATPLAKSLGKAGPIPAGALVVVHLGAAFESSKGPQGSSPAILFGGEHGGAGKRDGHPPHGCPAREAGTDILLGVVQAVLERTNLRRERRGVLSYDKPKVVAAQAE